MSSIKWLPLESNPDVMNKFLANLGVPAFWGISDVSMDEESIDIPVPSLALLLLFPITNKYTEYCEKQEELQKENQQVVDGVYYMKQTIRNGCGTIALIHVIANNESKLDLQADSVLKKFIDSTKDLSPEERGKVLEQNLVFSAIQDSSAQEGQTEAPNLDDGVNLHFIAIVNVNGKLVELDKRKISCSYAGCFCAACFRAGRLAVNFLMRRTSPVAEFRRAPGESYHYRRRPPSRSRSGRKMKGRGNVRYRIPESSDERSGSETPPHWKLDQSRLKSLKDVIPKKDNGPSDEIAMSPKNSGNLRKKSMYV